MRATLVAFSLGLLLLGATLLQAQDPDLKQAQQTLKSKGYDPGPADGWMGPKTRDALKQFQKDNNLSVTGELDGQTHRALVSGGGGAIPRDLKDEAERARESAAVLGEIMGIPEKGIPKDLLEKARAVAVIPHVVKGAFGIGGRYGKGLIASRNQGGSWTAPAYVEIGGGSVGLQIGVSATDVVLVFTNDEGLKPLLKGKMTVGADASAVAGPVGRTGNISTDVLLKSSIFSYSRSKGLFAGVALDGAVITMDDSANQKVYQQDVSGEDILLDRKVSGNDVVRPFLAALQQHVPPYKP